MTRIVKTHFGADAEYITVETTPYKDGEGCRIWTDGTKYYGLRNTGRHACRNGVTWAAERFADDIISNPKKYGTHLA